ncbi:hypothetical protein [Vibrio agarivorans]|uniref:hypothetical protein n=1 Tax=Vibrio agarivorans TaxID=153622 RepID=UPI0025B28AC5|nr:hypothetical protein [Vibrio agarivorans]MDN3663464.1 hypothetical protein [Vibrio agarivorans]
MGSLVAVIIGVALGSLLGIGGAFVGGLAGLFLANLGNLNGGEQAGIDSTLPDDNSVDLNSPSQQSSSLYSTLSSSIFNDEDEVSNSLDTETLSFDDDNSINPATGLPMVGGIGGLDVQGNPYGFDNSDDPFESSLSDPFEDDFMSTDDTSSMFDDDSFSSSFDDDWR